MEEEFLYVHVIKNVGKAKPAETSDLIHKALFLAFHIHIHCLA